MTLWAALFVLGGAADAASEKDVPAPVAVVVATSRGERRVPVSIEQGHPALAVVQLADVLPVSARVEEAWADVGFAGQAFRFLLDAPLFEFQNRIIPVVGGAYVLHDTLYVPLQWLAEYVPRVFHEAYRYDPLAARFEEIGISPVATRVSQPPGAPVGSRRAVRDDVPEAARKLGLRSRHKVVVDAGHGGEDPGTQAGGLTEKDIALMLARYLDEALTTRGIDVVMTRTRDVFVPLAERAPKCSEDCDLFVSIHVNALARRRGYQSISGLETYFFDHRRSAAPDRIEAVENAALRYETDIEDLDTDPLGFILRDLAENEFLRESAQLAELVQQRGAAVHPNGGNRVGQRNFVVLRLATRPAILVETGYSTNPTDARFLASRTGQQRLAGAIADGIVQYLLRYETMVNP